MQKSLTISKINVNDFCQNFINIFKLLIFIHSHCKIKIRKNTDFAQTFGQQLSDYFNRNILYEIQIFSVELRKL